MSETSEGVGAAPAAERRPGVQSTVWLAIGGLVAAGVLAAIWSGSTSPEHQLEQACIQEAAKMAGVDAGELTSEKVGTSKVALDFRGTLPGGGWACAGEKGNSTPLDVQVWTE